MTIGCQNTEMREHMKILYCEIDFPHEKGEFCPRNIFDYYFIGCFSTPFLYEIDQKFLQGNPGDLLIMPPGTMVYHGPQSSKEAFVNDWLYVTGNDFIDLLEKYPLPENTAFHISEPLLLKNCIKKIKEESLLKYTGYEEIISCCLTETIIEMHRLYQRNQSDQSPLFRLEAAREAFLRHPERDWSLQDMATLCDYSVSRFSALYMEHFGCSPKADLLAYRIELSRQMLHYSELSITEIAERCGFKSIYYFSRYFKEKEGISPSEYVTSVRRNHPY